MSELTNLMRRDLAIYWQNKNHTCSGMLFYTIVLAMFAFNSGVTPVAIWTAALLSTLISLPSMFKDDYDAGVFSYLLCSSTPISALILIKTMAHWIATQVPILLVTPIFAIDMCLEQIILLEITLLIGTIGLSLIGAIGAAVTIGLSQAGILTGVIVLPLYFPLLVLAACCSDALQHQVPYIGYLALLSALVLAVLLVAPIATGAALRVNLR